MRLTAEVFAAALREATALVDREAEVSGMAANILAAWVETAEAVATLHRKSAELKVAYDCVVTDNNEALRELRRTCTHPLRKHESSPCVQDGWGECDVCGGAI